MSKAKDGSERRRGADASEALVGGWFASSEPLADVEWQQVAHVGTGRTLRQLGEHFAQVLERLNVARPTGEHQAVDRCTGFRPGHRIIEQPRFSAGRKRSNFSFLST